MVSPFRRYAGGAFALLILLYLYAPIAVIVLFSFTASPRLAIPIEGFTLDWYVSALSNTLITTALLNSAILAVVSALAATLLGGAFAFGVVKLASTRARRVLLAGGLLPAVVPLLVIGISLAVFFRGVGMAPGLLNAAIGHAIVCLPFVILTMNSRLETFDFSVLEAARDLGASPARAFLDVTLPLIRPALVGAALLSAALSLDEFVVTWFNIGNELSLPVLVWGLMRRGIDPSINAIAVMLLATLVVLVIASNFVGRRRGR